MTIPMRKLPLLGMLGFLLSACTSSQFDCPHTAGISCQSLDHINQRIDAGTLPLLALQNLPKGGRLC